MSKWGLRGELARRGVINHSAGRPVTNAKPNTIVTDATHTRHLANTSH